MIFDGADRVRGRRQEGRGKRGSGVGRGEKKVKIWEGGEKRKTLRAPLRGGRRETRDGRGEAYPLSTPHI